MALRESELTFTGVHCDSIEKVRPAEVGAVVVISVEPPRALSSRGRARSGGHRGAAMCAAAAAAAAASGAALPKQRGVAVQTSMGAGYQSKELPAKNPAKGKRKR